MLRIKTVTVQLSIVYPDGVEMPDGSGEMDGTVAVQVICADLVAEHPMIAAIELVSEVSDLPASEWALAQMDHLDTATLV